ncbi:leucyl/phenylalanyl-tRNA--protein transferase [Angustibacter sp. McL0619]|uniref:leucyl/phenylalanyl-tRNA--protein transferase n=1 Tax=Angustibacter sp. McL0619 TaxID=3415676 RepID=UPI003CF6B673
MPQSEPPPSPWDLDVDPEAGEDLVGVGADLAPGTILAAYRRGLFPMGIGSGGRAPLGWWSPDPRGVLPLDSLRVSRSLRRMLPRFEIRIDTAFADVVRGCADPGRDGAWITPAIAAAYQQLHELGWAHSVECWRNGDLVGGLYGLAIGGLFAGESMFHRERDASKVALAALVEVMRAADDSARRLLDVQWRTEHLASLGVVELPREDYLRRLRDALELAPPVPFS